MRNFLFLGSPSVSMNSNKRFVVGFNVLALECIFLLQFAMINDSMALPQADGWLYKLARELKTPFDDNESKLAAKLIGGPDRTQCYISCNKSYVLHK